MARPALDIPYYAQTAEFTCGPACVLMTLSALGVGRSPWRPEDEFRVWRRTNLIGVHGADAFGLALPFVDEGLQVRVFNERFPTFPDDRIRTYAGTEEAVRLVRFAAQSNRAELESKGIEILDRAPTVADVEAGLADGWVPNCMVGMQEVHNEEIPHWVVATRVDADGVRFHDPYGETDGRADLVRSRETFQRMLDDIGTMGGSRAMVLVRRSA